MSTSLMLLLIAVVIGLVAALVWWQRGKLSELQVLTPDQAQHAPPGTELVVFGRAAGEPGTSPFTGANGLLFSAEEVTEWTERSHDDDRDHQRRETRSLGISGVLTGIEGEARTMQVRSGSSFVLNAFRETRTASQGGLSVSLGGGAGLSLSSGNRRSWVEEKTVHVGDDIWVRGTMNDGALDGSIDRLEISGQSVATQLRQQLIIVVIMSIVALGCAIAAAVV